MIMKYTEPVISLFLDEDSDGPHYYVTVPVRIAGKICTNDLATMHQFLDAVEKLAEYVEFVVEYIGTEERKAWASARKELLSTGKLGRIAREADRRG